MRCPAEKMTEFVRVILVQAIFPYRSRKKNYPSQILTVILARGPCSNILSRTIFVQSRAAVSRGRNSVILAQGPCNIVQRKRRHQAQSEVRTSGPALEGTIVSPLVNTTSGLSGGRRGGDVSGAAPAPIPLGDLAPFDAKVAPAMCQYDVRNGHIHQLFCRLQHKKNPAKRRTGKA